MRNLPPVMSETRLARCSQPPNRVSRLFGQLAVMRQRISPDWAIAGAASVVLAAATPIPAVLMNLRRFMKAPPLQILIIFQADRHRCPPQAWGEDSTNSKPLGSPGSAPGGQTLTRAPARLDR